MKYPPITLPLRVSTKSNRRGHWRKFAASDKAERGLTCAAVNNLGVVRGPTDQIHVTFTRYAPRMLDKWDGLPNSFKCVIDGLADAIGPDDSSPLYVFDFRQAKSKEYKIVIEVEIVEQ